MRLTESNKRGFTIIEAVIALAVFSFMLVLFALTYIQINRLFVKGQTIKRMNETARLLIEDIAKNTRLASESGVTILPLDDPTKTVDRLCIDGGARYGWVTQDLDPATDIDSYILRSFDGQDCELIIEEQVGSFGSGADSIQTTGASSFLSENIDLRAFRVTELEHDGADVGILIEFTLSAGSDDLFDGLTSDQIESQACAGTLDSARQFCDVVKYSTFVSYRN